MENRQKLIKELIEYSKDPAELVNRLSEFSWDSDKPLAKLEIIHIVNALQLFISESISMDQIKYWANAIEVREDIEFDEVCKELIYLLANPELNDQKIDKKWARDVVAKLS